MVILQLFMKMDGFNLPVKSHNCRFGDCKSLLCVKKVDLFSKSVYIHQFFLDAKCKENAFVRQVSRYHAYYSLDDPDFVVEQYALFLTQTPADTVERKHYFRHIDREIQALSPKQTHRLYGYYYLGLSMQDIANKEGVSVGSVSECIKSALTALRERCNLFNF